MKKKRIKLVLSSLLLFSLLLSGCANSQEGTTTSVSTSAPVSLGKTSSRVVPSEPVSAESPSTAAESVWSSVPTVSSSKSSAPVKDPRIRVSTDGEVAKYYEEHPEWKTYFYEMVAPLGPLTATDWSEGGDVYASRLFVFWENRQSAEKIAGYPEYPVHDDVLLDVYMVPAEEFERDIETYFDMDATRLRQYTGGDEPRMGIYSEEYHTYHHGYPSLFYLMHCAIINEVRQEGSDLYIFYRYMMTDDFPERRDPPPIPDEPETRWELHIRLLEDGSFRYVSQKQIA